MFAINQEFPTLSDSRRACNNADPHPHPASPEVPVPLPAEGPRKLGTLLLFVSFGGGGGVCFALFCLTASQVTQRDDKQPNLLTSFSRRKRVLEMKVLGRVSPHFPKSRNNVGDSN